MDELCVCVLFGTKLLYGDNTEEGVSFMDSNDSKIIGNNIRRARKRQLYTQQELAEEADLSVTHIAHLECGTANLSADSLVKLCEVLYVTPNDLLRGCFKASETTSNAGVNSSGFPIKKKSRDLILDIADLLTRYQNNPQK